MGLKWYRIFDSAESAQNFCPERKIRKVLVKDKFYCISRNGEQWYAFDETCPHQYKSLVRGECTEDGKVECPVHKYRFNLENGQGHGLYLPVYPVKIESDGVYIGIERPAWDIF